MSCRSELIIRCLIAVLVMGAIMCSQAQGAQADFYVATIGNDAWSGMTGGGTV